MTTENYIARALDTLRAENRADHEQVFGLIREQNAQWARMDERLVALERSRPQDQERRLARLEAAESVRAKHEHAFWTRVWDLVIRYGPPAAMMALAAWWSQQQGGKQ